MKLEEPVARFLRSVGWEHACRLELSGDASVRRYERLTHGLRSAIVMLVPPGNEQMTSNFLAVTDWLRERGFSAPEIFAADPGLGLVLMEDLGDSLFRGLCEVTPWLEATLYEAAIDVLADLHAQDLTEGTGWLPAPYDTTTLLREARLPLEWYLPSMPSEAMIAEYEGLLTAAFGRIAPYDAVPVYRDYHAENLVWISERRGRQRVGLLDYQDMLAGHPAYDVVSLLEDARRDVSPDLRSGMMARYIARTGSEAESFRYAAQLFSAQRNLKILGIFARLAGRDAKPTYLALLPRVWGHLLANLSHPDLSRLMSFVLRQIPPPDACSLDRLAARHT